MMDLFNQSDKLDAAAATRDLSDDNDASCSTGYDNDGSTGAEIFENGARLVREAGDKPIWEIIDEEDSPPTYYYFIGTEEEVLARIEGCPLKDDSEDSEDEEDESEDD